jgi:hypothetical protein
MKYRGSKMLFLMLLGLALTAAGVPAAEEKGFVISTGEASLENTTPEDARREALNRARAAAIEEACGIRLQAETFVKDMKLMADFVHAVSYGNIVSEEILKWEVDTIQKSQRAPPALAYRVTLKARVIKEKGDPDPAYAVKARLNKTVYQSGDEMVITIAATKPSYITVLNFSADDRVILLFPNMIRRDNHIEANREYQIPTAQERDGVLKFRVSNLPGHSRDAEFIKVIATRTPVNLLDQLSLKGQFGIADTVSMAFTELARFIASVPIRDRAEDTVSYQIFSRGGR